MIDLHSHTLPGLCDGSQSLETSLEMARIAVADGITHLACTPHIYPGNYNNSRDTIEPAMFALQQELDSRNIPLKLLIGADTHLVPEVMRGLKDGSIPTLNNSRYFLLEPSHHVPVVNFLDHIGNYLNAGYIPLITHPERLHWVQDHYEDFVQAARMGAWIQITAGAITGRFGSKAQASAEQFLNDGLVHVIASDAHGTARRPPILSEGVQAAVELLGDEVEVKRMVFERPEAVVNNLPPEQVSVPPGLRAGVVLGSSRKASDKRQPLKRKGWVSRLFS